MSIANPGRDRHSTVVRMHLSINGHVFKIGQLGPDFIIVRQGIDLPPSEGEITVSIDGRTRTWPVRLPNGMTAGQPEIRITDGAALR